MARPRTRRNPDGTVRQGRLPTLTPELTEDIARLVEAGNYPEVAAQYHGVPRRTFWEWMARGRDPAHPRNVRTSNDTTLFAHLAQRIEQAEAQSEVRAVTTVMGAALDQSDAAMKFLERRHGGRWRQGVILTGQDGPIQVESVVSTFDDHERATLQRLVLAELERRETEGPAEADRVGSNGTSEAASG